ncbi:hypothetical protein GQ55_4G308100 [Panicum hallii var. hallii]|uniref:Uncharacterized protein n=1 Tax=Panicum hallii var. hallii TaxID=1504633 RepID=A0A2T7E207_9POAL|nr:hypothetical protein GQ55_4G308100 [Panicum hallii var. hallii]
MDAAAKPVPTPLQISGAVTPSPPPHLPIKTGMDSLPLPPAAPDCAAERRRLLPRVAVVEERGGDVGAEKKRFVVPTAYLGAPAFRRLLEKAEEFEFHYHGGALTIPCDIEAFKYIPLVTDRQGLAADDTKGGTPRKEDGESEARRPEDEPAADGVAPMNHGT